jgi:hypothetical protein
MQQHMVESRNQSPLGGKLGFGFEREEKTSLIFFA